MKASLWCSVLWSPEVPAFLFLPYNDDQDYEDAFLLSQQSDKFLGDLNLEAYIMYNVWW